MSEFHIADFRSLFCVYSTYLPIDQSPNPFSYNAVHGFASYTQRKMSNTTCRGPNAVPDPIQYPIPRDKSFAFLPAVNGNGSPPWMLECCQPNPVSLIDGCYLWCQLPAPSTVPAGVDFSNAARMRNFSRCLKNNGRNISESNIITYHFANGASGKMVGMAGMMVWVVLASGFVTGLL